MTPEEAVSHLLECRDPQALAHHLHPHPPEQPLEIITRLKVLVDQEKLKNAHAALAMADLTLALASLLSHPVAKGLALWARGNALHHLSRNIEALECYREAQHIYQHSLTVPKLEHPPAPRLDATRLEVARLQINQVAVLQAMGDCRQALALADDARTTCENAGPHGQMFLGMLEMNVGSAFQQMGRLEDALQAYARGRALYAAMGHVSGAARIDINRANVLEELNRFADARALLLSAHETLSRADQLQEVARAELNLGRLALRSGRYHAALSYLESAHQGFSAIPNVSDMALATLYRALVYRQLNLLTESITLAAEAFRTFKQDQSRWLQVLALVTQGLGLQRLGELKSAETLLSTARSLLAEMGWARVHEVDIDRAFLALEQGAYDLAGTLARQAERGLPPHVWPTLHARLHLLHARTTLLRAPHEPVLAQPFAEKALEMAHTHSLTELEIPALHLRGQLLERLGDRREAWQTLQSAIQRLERLRELLGIDEFRMSFMDDKLPIYADLVRLTCQLGTPADVLFALNKCHAAPLPQLMSVESAVLSSMPALGTRMKELREEWRWLQSALEVAPELVPHSPNSGMPEEATLRQQMALIERELTDLVRRRNALAGVQRPLDVEEVGIHPFPVGSAQTFLLELQQRLEDADALINFFSMDDQIHAVVVTRDAIRIFDPLMPEATLQRILQSWQFQVEHAGARGLSDGAHPPPHLIRLYDALLAPLTSSLEHISHLYLVYPSRHNGIPFSALYDGKSYLIERFCLTHFSAPEMLLTRPIRPPELAPQKVQAHPTAPPSAGTVHGLTAIDADHTSHACEALVIGHSDGGRLPNALTEAQDVAQVLSGFLPTHLLLELEAKAQPFRVAVGSSRLLHLATHATFRADNPLFSWLRLEDDRLTVADLYEISLPLRPLVFMSACETGRGKAHGGGLLGMSRALLAAGASGLIVSHWKVADQATARLAADFYRRLEISAQTPAELADSAATALQSAQRAAISRHAHPFFWAGFIFVRG